MGALSRPLKECTSHINPTSFLVNYQFKLSRPIYVLPSSIEVPTNTLLADGRLLGIEATVSIVNPRTPTRTRLD